MIKFILENFDTIFKNENSLETLNKVILDLAIRGKLVPQNENDESADELLKRIQSEKERLVKEKIIKKEKPLPPIEEDEIPFDIPKNWEYEKLGNLLISITKGATPTTYGFHYQEKGINFLKVENVKNGKVMLESIKTFISAEANEFQKRSQLKDGDILFSIAGTIGETCIIKKEYLPANTNQAFAILKGGNIVFVLEFLKLLLNSLVLQQAKKLARGGAMNNISLDDIKQMLVLIPPIEEQKRIVEKVEKLQKFIKNLKEIYSSDEKNRNNLKRSLLIEIEKSSDDTKLLNNLELVFNNFDKIVKTKEDIEDIRNLILSLAIKGKLVPQNEKDEPAGELLKKIQVEKERLIKEKVIKKEKPLPKITEKEIPFDIPKNWEWVRLRDIAYINPKNIADDNIITSFIPMKLISDGYINKHSSENKFWKEIKNGFTHFQNEDIGIAKITPCFENRKSVIFKNLKNCIGAGTTELYIIRLFLKDIENRYLLNIFKTEDFIKKGVGTYTGTAGQQRVKREFIENYLIPLPPLEEQKRIVEKIENLMEICNLLEEKIDISEKISENLLKSFMNNGE